MNDGDGSVCVRACVRISTIAAVHYQRFVLRDKAATVLNGSEQTGAWMGVGIQQIRGTNGSGGGQ